MTIKKFGMASLSVAFLLLAGCTNTGGQDDVMLESAVIANEPPKYEETITITVGERVRVGKKYYLFSGFVNEDTFVFERNTQSARTTYHQATIGYKFILPYSEHSAEVKSFDRKKGTITISFEKISD